MLISYNWLSSYMTNPENMPSPQRVADLFTMQAFEIDSMEEKHGDTVYDIKILPDRSPYIYGIRYVALELTLLVPELTLKPQYEEYIKTDIDVSAIPRSIVPTLIDTEAQNLCSLYTLTHIENIHNNASPKDIVEKLNILGQQSRGTIVDLTNLVMNDSGQPLHTFDADKIDGKIRVSVLDADTDVTILGGKKISLKSGTLVIRDDTDILAIAGVKGCVKAEVTESTKNIFLEAASFDRVTVRKTSRSLDLINDSSKRFEQGVTSERPIVALQAFVEHVQELMPEATVHPTEVSKNIADIFVPEKLTYIDVNVARCVKLIDDSDASLEARFIDFIEHVLPKTGAKVEKSGIVGGSYIVTAPLYRADLQKEVDVVDEYIRHVGYETIRYVPTEQVASVTQEKQFQVFQAIRKFLVQKGYTEVILHTLIDSKKHTDVVRLANSLTSERDALRSDLSPELLNAIVKNYPYLDLVEKKSVQLFEIGIVHTEIQVEGLPVKSLSQRTYLALGIGMPKWPKKIDDVGSHTNLLGDLSVYLGLDTQTLAHAKVSKSTDATAHVTEIDITDIIEKVDLSKIGMDGQMPTSHAPRIATMPYKKASIYPSMSRDIAFFIEGQMSRESVDEYIRETAKKFDLIETVTLFDVFEKDGKTSYGYRFVFQSYEKTLKEEEVSTIMSSIAKAVADKGWIVR